MLLVMPADHVMTDVAAFLDAIEAARQAGVAGALATFGITPSHPETGYGYIVAGDPVAGYTGVHAVRRVVERRAHDRAEELIADGGDCGNGGRFGGAGAEIF